MSGTAQGHTGFYLNPSSNSVYYWIVKDNGEWVDIFKEFSFDDYKEMDTALRRKKGVDGDSALVPVPGTGTEDGNEGYYVNTKSKAAYYVVGEGGALEVKG